MAILGALGYIQDLLGLEWLPMYSWLLLSVFILLTLAEVLLERQKDKRAADDFYADQITEIFAHDTSEDKLGFFTDKGGNKCVAITLQRAAIPNSIKLWEGGYSAPAFTFFVKDNIVVFRNSAYGSNEEYTKPGPVYSVQYYPKESGVEFRNPVK
jgi:hypothetical protein